MLATKSVENIQFLPFLTTDVNNLSWLGYGCLKQDLTLIAVNAIGAALQTLYILAYLYYSPAKRPVLLRSLLLLAVLAAGYGYFTLLIADGRTRLARLGLFCSVFTISMYLSPLADLAKIVRSKSTRCLSFPLTVTTFLASTSWTLYGLQLRDPYITDAQPGTPLASGKPSSGSTHLPAARKDQPQPREGSGRGAGLGQRGHTEDGSTDRGHTALTPP
ncbi:sugar transporter SWEET1 isoform X2 [Larus michahellis]|uniref:sugar transporter SWEET1 isoform X2 n=1 Tax=Larus michahellis TaxID=119627 RepID=UPI003D9BE70D